MLGGMSWESSAEYYRLVNELVRERLGGLHSARCVLLSVDFADIEELQVAGRLGRGGRAAGRRGGRGCEAAGADLLLLCTNTMHKVADQIEAAIAIPLLHLARRRPRRRSRGAGCARVGLLGTAFTMEQDFYRDRLAAHGLDVLVPAAGDRARGAPGHLRRAVPGHRPGRVPRRRTARSSTGWSRPGREGVILGCTEIELLVGAGDSPVPVFPTTRLHVEAAVDLALARH